MAQVPLFPTRFVGRAADLDKIEESLRQAPLVSLLGPPGVGKTRLLAEHARRSEMDVIYTSAAESTDVASLCAAIANALDLTVNVPNPEAAIELIGEELQRRKSPLVILDELEALIEPAVLVVSTLMASCDARYLISSRRRLDTAGETVLQIAPLGEVDALALLLDRAEVASGRSWKEHEEVVQQIANRLSGLPLAIELAAGLGRVLGPAQLLEELDQSGHEVLEAIPGHVRSLSHALESSWSRLGENAGDLSAVTVFRGGFTAEAAAAVLGVSRLQVLSRLNMLRDRSLLTVADASEDSSTLRMTLLPAIREFAMSKLRPQQQQAAQKRHAEYYISLGQRAHEELWESHRHSFGRRLRLERHNLASVFEWTLANVDELADEALSVASWLALIAEVEGPLSWGIERLDKAITLATKGNAEARCIAYVARSHNHRKATQMARARSDAEFALELAKSAGDELLVHKAHNVAGLAALFSGDSPTAYTYFEEALVSAKKLGDRRQQAGILCNLAHADMDEGRHRVAEARYGESVRLFEDLGDDRGRAVSLANYGYCAVLGDDFGAARTRLQGAVEAGEQIGDIFLAATARCELAWCDELEGKRALALAGYRAALAQQQRFGKAAYESLCGVARNAVDKKEARLAITEARQLVSESATGEATAFVAITQAHIDLSTTSTEDLVAQGRIREVAETYQSSPFAAVRKLASRLAQAMTSTSFQSPAVAVDLDGNWLRLPGEELIDLSKRAGPRSLLAALVKQRLEKPGQPLSMDELFEAGWPGVNIAPSAAASRVYVAMTALRKAGLKPLLLRNDAGYMLDPDQAFVHQQEQ